MLYPNGPCVTSCIPVYCMSLPVHAPACWWQRICFTLPCRFFFDKTSCLYLCKEYIDGYSTDTGTIWKDTEGQLSYTFCTKASTEKRKYNNALGNFCTCPASSPSPTSSAAAVQSTSFRRKRLQLQDQRKPHRPEALKRAATERTQEGTSVGDAPRTSLATDPNLTPVNRTAKTRIRPP